jgi:hypothetical protein
MFASFVVANTPDGGWGESGDTTQGGTASVLMFDVTDVTPGTPAMATSVRTEASREDGPDGWQEEFLTLVT